MADDAIQVYQQQEPDDDGEVGDWRYQRISDRGVILEVGKGFASRREAFDAAEIAHAEAQEQVITGL
jgi:hypothetical protein